MKIEFPSVELAHETAVKYREMGVEAHVEFVGKSWCCVLDDETYKKYLDRQRANELLVLKRHRSTLGGATNLQEGIYEPPVDSAKRLNLYILHPECLAIKEFQITVVGRVVLDRQWEEAAYGTTCSVCGKETKVVIRWDEQ